MSERNDDTRRSWNDPDDALEWDEDAFGRAEIAVGGEIVRPATGTLTRRGRPPIGDVPKQQVTLRLPREVIAHFKAEGPGWQSRIGDVLQRHIGRRPRRKA
jgi:uncharacterized protein (DUF4415 family)